MSSLQRVAARLKHLELEIKNAVRGKFELSFAWRGLSVFSRSTNESNFGSGRVHTIVLSSRTVPAALRSFPFATSSRAVECS